MQRVTPRGSLFVFHLPQIIFSTKTKCHRMQITFPLVYPNTNNLLKLNAYQINSYNKRPQIYITIICSKDGEGVKYHNSGPGKREKEKLLT